MFRRCRRTVSREASAICAALAQTTPCVKLAIRASATRVRVSPTHICRINVSGNNRETSKRVITSWHATQAQNVRTKRALRGFRERKVKNALDVPISSNCLNAANEASRNTIRPYSSGPSQRAKRSPVKNETMLRKKFARKLAVKRVRIDVDMGCLTSAALYSMKIRNLRRRGNQPIDVA